MAENAQPIIIKKVKKVTGGGAHGGSWKVAYADFVTAMMAFFLLLWLLNVSDPETLGGIAEYFENPSIVHAAGGASTSVIELGSHVDMARGEGQQMRDANENDYQESYGQAYQQVELLRLKEMKEQIEDMINSSTALASFKDQIMLDITNEGLRIQIMDKDKRPMFDLGSKNMKRYTQTILRKLAPLLAEVPNKLSISGHTDARRFYGEEGYTNWELSADRANAARRQLIAAKIPAAKIARVVGLADKAPFDAEHPTAAINRRISIIVLNKAAEDAIYRDAGAQGSKTLVPAILPHELKEAIKKGAVERSGMIQR